MCISAGGRLCTSIELEMGCARGSGCSLDDHLVWSSGKNRPQFDAAQEFGVDAARGLVPPLYGRGGPRILGLDRCQAYRAATPVVRRRFGVAGLFNTGTSLLQQLLVERCAMPGRAESRECRAEPRWQSSVTVRARVGRICAVGQAQPGYVARETRRDCTRQRLRR